VNRPSTQSDFVSIVSIVAQHTVSTGQTFTINAMASMEKAGNAEKWQCKDDKSHRNQVPNKATNQKEKKDPKD
jgi:hypothetical protein